MNFYVYELMPPSDRAHLGWLTWLVGLGLELPRFGGG